MRKTRLSFPLLMLCAVLALSAQAMAYNTGDDYPTSIYSERYGREIDLKNSEQDSLTDPWNFYNRECTSFVAWCLNTRNGVAFTNQYGGVSRWGHAYEWANIAKGLGYTVDMNPAVGSVFWQDATGSNWTGHVAWVKSVNGDGTVTIEQYNSTYVYSTGARLPAGCWSEDIRAVTAASGYIHIQDIGSGTPELPSSIPAPSITVSDRNVTITWSPIEQARWTSVRIRSGHSTKYTTYSPDSPGLAHATLEPGNYEAWLVAGFGPAGQKKSDIAEFAINIDSGTCGDHLTWVLSPDRTLTISGAGPMWNWETWWDSEKGFQSNTPWFDYQTQNAHWSLRIDSVVIEHGVTSIGDNAFNYGSMLDATIADTVTTIGNGAFQDSSLSRVTIPSSVTSIGDEAFCCGRLTDVTVPGGVKHIGERAFSGCRDVTVQRGITNIGPYAFSGCSFVGAPIPDGVVAIGAYAFSGCGFTSLTIPDSVVQIGDGAFSGSSLTSIPEGLSVITDYMFSGCNSLVDVSIPDGVTNIGDRAFQQCSSLKSVSIPDSVTRIDYGAFSYCTGLSSVRLPGYLDVIEAYLFCGCSNLTGITIPDGVAEIGFMAFANCQSLNSASIPDTVYYFGTDAFSGCDALSDVYYRGSSVQLRSRNIYSGNDSLTNARIHYAFTDEETIGTFGANLTWELDADGTLTISGTGPMWNWWWSDYYSPALPYQNTIKKLVIEPGVTSIGSCAFMDCTNLQSVSIPSSVKCIQRDAFHYCTSLKSVAIPRGVSTISEYAFCSCTSLTGISLPASVTSIGGYTFADCVSLKSVVFPSGITIIQHGMFYDCPSLRSVYIPAGVTVIGDHVFYNANSLSDVYFGGTEQQWQEMIVNHDNDALSSAVIHYYAAPPQTGASAISITGGAASVSVYAAEPATAYFAAYDALGRFLGVETQVLTPGAENDLAFAITDSAKTLKLFILDRQGVPLCVNASTPR